ncbi:hypothetical protein DRE_01789 [Drechslerella stenobrocha 248]|uniref:RFTS domain-containing protein n=1 Tax=Drechslerella stenobrocha 248 TaxID=1043628 RepID=W7I931_9PEZI|nr:hypothetical protein DRE_01789 [Drechslerella stenobrocha 248]
MLELTALKEQNPNKVHPDDWPTCDLYDATVTSKKSSRTDGLIDLLDVLEKGPFHVKGRIRTISGKLEEFVLNQNLVNCEIIIANVRRWSIERLPDEKIIIWALGNAAWYGIHPAKSYQEIYDSMLQKAAIYNFIVDKYGGITTRGQSFKTPMQTIYAEMAENPVLGTPKEVEALVEKHRRFIIAQLLEEGKFKRTPFWKFMNDNYADEIEEVRAVIVKVTLEILNDSKKKAERLSKSPPLKDAGTSRRRLTRNRSGTASSGVSEGEAGSKRKSRDHSTDEPDAIRQKMSSHEQPSGKSTPAVRLAHKSRRSNRVVLSDSPAPSPPDGPAQLQLPLSHSQEQVVLSGRTTRSTRSSQPSPMSPGDLDIQPAPSSGLAFHAATLQSLDLTPPQPSINLPPEQPRPPVTKPAAGQPPPAPKPSLDTLKEILDDMLPRPRSSQLAPKSASLANKLSAKTTQIGIIASSPGILRNSTTAQRRTPVPGVVPLDENHPGYDDLRDQAISKLTQLHSLYQKISKSKSQTEYQKFAEMAEENFEWRRQHGLKPVYIDVIYATGYYTDDIAETSVIRRVPATEYLVDTMEWDFDTAVELLQNVNRGTYFHELLQPVKEARRNARVKGNRAGRGRPRKVAQEEIEMSMSTLKISNVPSGRSVKDGPAPDMSWNCPGLDERGGKCGFVVDDASSLEGAKEASDHWRGCPMRKRATDEALAKKKANIEQAQTVLRDQQVRDPWTNIDHLVDWLEGEANKSRSWFPAGVC